MASRTLAISRLMKSERLAIALLRGIPGTRLDGDTAPRFETLRRNAIDLGLSIPPPDSPYASADEARLLAWLAAMQRQKPSRNTDMPAQLADSLHICACALTAIGLKLDFRAVARCQLAAATTVPEPICEISDPKHRLRRGRHSASHHVRRRLTILGK